MTRRLLLLTAAITPLWTLLLWRVDLLVALLPLFLSHLLLLYPTFAANSQWLGPVVTHFCTDAREVWLTIDDGPTETHTRRMLDLLEQHQATATFFVVGRRAQQCPRLVAEIVARGHSLGNHTLNHPLSTFWCATPARIQRELDWANAPGTLFRAPAGMKNLFVHPSLRDRQLMLVGWSARGFDSIRSHPENVAKKIASRLRPGVIILLHEGVRETLSPDYSVRCLELVLRTISDGGYRCVIPAPEQMRP